jgi:hypothetical protein
MWLVLAALLMRPFDARAAEEETFPLVQIGTQTYTNATVTTKAKDYIFILHAGGMTSIKLGDVPAELRLKLGYGGKQNHKTGTNNPAAWARAGVAKLQTKQVREMGDRLAQAWHGNKSAKAPLAALVNTKAILVLAGTLLLVYLFNCYCFMLICRKAGHTPGPLVWIPVLQFFPLLRAAGMSAWWFLAHLLPVLNLVTFVLWSVNIAKARGKSGWVVFFLILPPSSFFAILYLAFSNGATAAAADEEPQVISLQAA